MCDKCGTQPATDWAINRPRESWDEFFLWLADYVSTRSKDPSTRVGAVIARPDNTIASMGYNGFPRCVEDTPERLADREMKLMLTIHAEINAVLNAREDVRGYTLYTTFAPCARCASTLVQVGIARVVYYREPIPERWANEMAIARQTLIEGGVLVSELDDVR